MAHHRQIHALAVVATVVAVSACGSSGSGFATRAAAVCKSGRAGMSAATSNGAGKQGAQQTAVLARTQAVLSRFAGQLAALHPPAALRPAWSQLEHDVAATRSATADLIASIKQFGPVGSGQNLVAVSDIQKILAASRAQATLAHSGLPSACA